MTPEREWESYSDRPTDTSLSVKRVWAVWSTPVSDSIRNIVRSPEGSLNSVQLLGQFATDLGQKVDTVSKEVGKMEEYGRRYDELEKDVRNIHNVLVGSYTKGKAGEQALETALGQPGCASAT